MREFHQTFIDDVVETKDEQIEFEVWWVKKVMVKFTTRSDVQNFEASYLYGLGFQGHRVKVQVTARSDI